MMRARTPWKHDEPAGDRFRGEIAETYLAERAHRPVWAREQQAVARYLSTIGDGARVLDVPFGTGRFAGPYRQHAFRVTGIDSSPDMLKVARNELGSLYDEWDIRVGEAAALPYADGQFDLVVCVRFLESIIPFKDVRPCLKEFRRVCRNCCIVRLNSRPEAMPPIGPPEPQKRMDAHFHISELADFVRGAGWEMAETTIIDVSEDGRSERRICLLDAV